MRSVASVSGSAATSEANSPLWIQPEALIRRRNQKRFALKRKRRDCAALHIDHDGAWPFIKGYSANGSAFCRLAIL